MSEKEPQKIFQIETFRENTKINIEVPVELVSRLNQLLLEFIPFKDEKHFFEVMKNISDKKFDDPFAYHVSTVLFLLNIIEDAAREQDKLDMVEYNSETKEKTVLNKKDKE